jgi:2,3,4,5-tetrahydropyridine-2-carboxylate N-succinyltransferase
MFYCAAAARAARTNGNKQSETMSAETLQATIDAAWEDRANVSPATKGEVRDAIEAALDGLDSGAFRVAEPAGNGWAVNQWLKKAVLLSFRLYDNVVMPGGPADPVRGQNAWYDKVSPKFAGWDDARFREAGFRAVPDCTVRRGAYLAPGVVAMPSFINIGAYVDSGTMVDTWATVGSCAQIGKNCHISGGAGIGGVLEPLQADPVIVEDGCFIGARSEVAEGVIVEKGAVLSMGVFLGASTKIVDRDTGEVFSKRVPAFSVVVPGTLPGRALPDGSPGPALYCAVIVKRVDEQTRAKTSINDLLRA